MVSEIRSQASVVDEIVSQLQSLCRLHGIERALRIGKIVVDGCFSGDPRALKCARVLPVSYRKLARRPDLPVSASAISRAVGVHELSGRISWIVRSSRLSLAHLEAVLPLPDDAQEAFLFEAEQRGLTARALRGLVREARHRSGGKRGRPPLDPKRRLLKNIKRVSDDFRGVLSQCEELGVDMRMIDELRATLGHLTELSGRLDAPRMASRPVTTAPSAVPAPAVPRGKERVA